jgi:NAD(P)-dependent dehydrogenase (short-subunit alcohol dehydrogenase family)
MAICKWRLTIKGLKLSIHSNKQFHNVEILKDERMLLGGRVVLVTGAVGTLGSAIRSALAEHGGICVATDLQPVGEDDLMHDVTSETDWSKTVDAIANEHGRLDGLVNNAGVIHIGNIETTSRAAWQRTLDVNTTGVFLGCKACWPLLQKSDSPSIVNVSSVSGIVGSADLVAYNASKGAVGMITKSVALHGARSTPPVRCNSIHPCLIEGEMTDSIIRARADNHSVRDQLRSNIPLGRFATPQEVASSIVFLLSNLSTIVTGSALISDGGYTAR